MTLRASFLLFAASALVACGDNFKLAPSAEAANATAPSADAKEAANASDAPSTSLAQQGRRNFSVCGACHSVSEGDNSRSGPNLYGVYGRAAGSLENFAYSKAMRESGVVWTDDALDAYLENPKDFIPGNRMLSPGERNAERRAAIIAYLKTFQPKDN
jgi:cytochrome c